MFLRSTVLLFQWGFCYNVPLFFCVIFQLSHCFIVPVFYCGAVALCLNATFLPWHCSIFPVCHYFTFPLLPCPVLLFHCPFTLILHLHDYIVFLFHRFNISMFSFFGNMFDHAIVPKRTPLRAFLAVSMIPEDHHTGKITLLRVSKIWRKIMVINVVEINALLN